MSSASVGLWTRNLNCAHESNKLLSGRARIHSRSRRWRTYGTDPSFRFPFRKLERRTRIPDLDCEPARIDRRGIVDTFPHEDKADLKRTPPYAKGRRSPIFTNSFHRNGDGAASRKGTTAHRNQASADHPRPRFPGMACVCFPFCFSGATIIQFLFRLHQPRNNISNFVEYLVPALQLTAIFCALHRFISNEGKFRLAVSEILKDRHIVRTLDSLMFYS
jgi:hypothetical protein